MTSPNYTITFACYNQLDYTKQFIASLDREEVDFSRIVAVDNGSTDGTREWLGQQGFGAVILNDRNLGCGAAWNQGALAIQSKWTVVMNNDVICAKGWLRNLLAAAELHELQIASPAMVEGDLNYDLGGFSINAQEKMQGYIRRNFPHAVCMAIREDVWQEIGYFMPIPRLLGYEDILFFQKAKEAVVNMGTCSNAWLHHYGQITQKAMHLERRLGRGEGLGNRKLMQAYMGKNWLQRKIDKFQTNLALKKSTELELRKYGMTVRVINCDDQINWI